MQIDINILCMYLMTMTTCLWLTERRLQGEFDQGNRKHSVGRQLYPNITSLKHNTRISRNEGENMNNRPQACL